MIHNTTRDTHVRRAVKEDKLLYDHTYFNETIEVLIKILDRFDRFDRIFVGAQDDNQ